MMRVLVWHWGRRGAGPVYAAALARHLDQLPEVRASLSLPDNAEILQGAAPPRCDLPVRTYAGVPGLMWRALSAPWRIGGLARRIAGLRPDVAVCAMPAMLDLLMAAALRRLGVPIAVVVHDAAPHPGERVPLQHRLQRRLLHRAAIVVTLSGHVAARLRTDGVLAGRHVIASQLPPLVYGPVPPPGQHGGALRVLSFGRLLPYKGLDLLAAALARLDDAPLDVRVVGQGPESPALAALRALPHVRVENRWVPDAEVGALLGWADALVLSHREASQSGVAAAALAAGRRVVATGVGGLAEQLRDEQQALLCAPEAEALARALQALVRTPAPSPAQHDPGGGAEAVWQRVAAALAADLADALRARPRSARLRGVVETLGHGGP